MTSDLERAGRKLRSARKALKDAMQAAEAASREAWEGGATEVEIAKTVGVDRMTVRKWRGKSAPQKSLAMRRMNRAR